MTELIVESNPKSPISEAYRTLRTNIQFSSFDNDVKVIMVTSSGPSEGKTTTTANLALTMAQNGNKVIIIDCDLRKPSVHKKFKISNKVGLSNVLADEIKFEEAMIKYSENLHIIPCGIIPPNPSEMLSSNKMKKFIEDMREKYDYVILDTPPVMIVTDAQIISTNTDGVVLVVSSGEVHIEACVKAKELLKNVNAKILGVVLNKAETRSAKSYGYYYYYSEDDKKHKKRK